MRDGVFLASTRRFVFDVTGPPGSGEWVVATRFYLLSRDGRFHRGWGLPGVPGGDIAAFDFDAMQAEDPYNTGRYSVEGELLVMAPERGEAEQCLLTGDDLLAEQLRFELAAPDSP